jgi:hypothetical protein
LGVGDANAAVDLPEPSKKNQPLLVKLKIAG